MVSNQPEDPDGGPVSQGNLDKVNLAEVPLSLEVLADLQAGVYDAGDAELLRQRADQDPDARQSLEALERVRADLAAWLDSPAPEVPGSVVDDIVAALHAESAKSTLPAVAGQDGRPGSAARPSLNLVTGPVPLDHRRRPAAKRRWIAYSTAGLTAAACAAVAVTLVAQNDRRTAETTTAVAGPSLSQQTAPKTGAPMAPHLPDTHGVRGESTFPISGTEITALVGRTPAFGDLEDAARRASCLAGLGFEASTPVLGAQTLDVDGPAVLMVLPAERPGELLAVAVRPGCSQADPQRVAQTRIGATPGR